MAWLPISLLLYHFDILCPQEPKYSNLHLVLTFKRTKTSRICRRISGYWLGSLAKRAWDDSSSAFSRRVQRKRDKGTQRYAKMLCSTTYMCLDPVHDFREMIFGVNMKLKVFNKRQALPSQHPKRVASLDTNWETSTDKANEFFCWHENGLSTSTGFDIVHLGRFATPKFTPKRGTRASRVTESQVKGMQRQHVEAELQTIFPKRLCGAEERCRAEGDHQDLRPLRNRLRNCVEAEAKVGQSTSKDVLTSRKE